MPGTRQSQHTPVDVASWLLGSPQLLPSWVTLTHLFGPCREGGYRAQEEGPRGCRAANQRLVSDSYYNGGFLLLPPPHYPNCLPHEWKSRLLRPPRARPADEQSDRGGSLFPFGLPPPLCSPAGALAVAEALSSLAGVSHLPPPRVSHVPVSSAACQGSRWASRTCASPDVPGALSRVAPRRCGPRSRQGGLRWGEPRASFLGEQLFREQALRASH